MVAFETLAIAAPIALLYPTFVNYLTDYYTKSDELNNECGHGRFYPGNDPNFTKAVIDKCDIRHKNAKTHKFVALLSAGVLGIAACGYANTFGVVLGLAIGSIICIFLGAVGYWDYVNTDIKTLASGIALVTMVVIANQMYDPKSKISQKIKTLHRLDVETST
jgi:hypothetical protein